MPIVYTQKQREILERDLQAHFTADCTCSNLPDEYCIEHLGRVGIDAPKPEGTIKQRKLDAFFEEIGEMMQRAEDYTEQLASESLTSAQRANKELALAGVKQQVREAMQKVRKLQSK